MGCFLACFGAPKDQRRRKPVNRIPSRERLPEHHKFLQPSSPLKRQLLPEEVVPGCPLEQRDRDDNSSYPLQLHPEEKAPNSVLELRDRGAKSSFASSRKKVTFDLNVKTYAEVPNYEDQIISSEDVEVKEKIKVEVKAQKEEGNWTPPSSGAYPLNNRYQYCTSSDDGSSGEDGDDDDDDYEDCDFDDELDGIDDKGNEEEESFDSYFSLPMEKERQIFKEVNSAKPMGCSSPGRKPTLLANQTARDRSQYVHSVLNPVENLSQWKEVKAKAVPLKHPKKENINLEQESEIPFSFEPSFKLPKPQKTFNCTSSPNVCTKQDVSVDASLSNWLPSLETTPDDGSKGNSSCRSNSWVSLDERPILGALTIEELKQSMSSSPRRSPSRSPDEIPILGTVGTHWNSTNQEADSGSSKRSGSDAKGIPNTTSKYREDKKVNWHSTPFEVRLERALNKGAAEAYSSYPPGSC